MIVVAADLLQPPERLTIAEASEKYIYINQPGAYVGPFYNSTAPYMVEPMNELGSRIYTGEIFVGPAQCAKTQCLLLNWTAYSVIVDPMDMILYNPSQANARDFATRRVDRMHRNSPEVGKRLSKRRDADNKTDKHYETGMILTLSWPTVNELAGKPVGRCAITDRDRMEDDIDGEGEIFDLASKRTTTFMSYGMTLCESSPSRPILDLKWVRTSPHEAPPCKGILGLYNRGDRRRWYWPCPECGSYFEGNWRMMKWDVLGNVMDSAESARLICPNPSCNHSIHPDQRQVMQERGRWVRDGQGINDDGVIYGPEPRTAICSFWLNGVAAAFTTWAKLVQTFMDASAEFDRTGSEEALEKFYNTDLGEPYVPKSTESIRLPEALKARAENLGGSKDEPVVPRGVRFLMATVDVQKNMFIVQIHGIGPGEPFDITLIDRYSIVRNRSGRINATDGQVEWVKPGTYIEDWDILIDEVIKRTYPLADNSGRRMAVKLTGCDSGGKAGVTANAYQFYRNLKVKGLASRFALVKGDHVSGAPRARVSYPDSSDTKNKAAARGDVPIWLLNSTLLKDALSYRLDSIIPGKGMIRFPAWLPDWFYKELCAEFRTDKGWEKPSGYRNEAWDLLYYCIGLAVSGMLNIEKMDWSAPIQWADEWDRNSLVILPDAKEPFANEVNPAYNFAAMARKLA